VRFPLGGRLSRRRRGRESSALGRPGRSLPGQNKEPFVKTLVVRSGELDSITFAHKVAVDQTVINLATFDINVKRD
jgi:hypothetical protein